MNDIEARMALVLSCRSEPPLDLVAEALSEIERLRSALLGHMQREGQECDKADAWDGAAASFEKGRREGLEEAAVIAQDQAQMWADHAAKADRASSRYEHRRASAGAGLVAAIIRAKLDVKP